MIIIIMMYAWHACAAGICRRWECSGRSASVRQMRRSEGEARDLGAEEDLLPTHSAKFDYLWYRTRHAA